MPSRTPLVSVVMPSYNCLTYLKACVASVLSQTVEDLEIVVADDGSTDGTREWLRGRREPRLRHVLLDRNRGASAARNRGLALARGRFVAFLDADDLWKPDFLEKMLPPFRDPGTMVAVCSYHYIDGRGGYRGRRRWTQVSLLLAVSGLPIILPSLALMRRDVAVEIGGFDEGIKVLYDDTDFFFRVGLLYGPPAFRSVRRILVARRRHEGAKTSLSAGHRMGELFESPSRERWEALNRAKKELTLDYLHIRWKHRAAADLLCPEWRRDELTRPAGGLKGKG